MWNARPEFTNMFQHEVMGMEGQAPKQNYITGIINGSRHLETQRLSTRSPLGLQSHELQTGHVNLSVSAAPGSRKSPLRHLDRFEKQKGRLWQLVFLHNCSADRERGREGGREREREGEERKEEEEEGRREREKEEERERDFPYL